MADAYEQEEDQMAEEIIQMKAQDCHCGRKCEACNGSKKRLVQRNTEPRSDTSTASVPDSVLENLGSGKALDSATQHFMESHLDHDFSHVRVHTDEKAAESAKA